MSAAAAIFLTLVAALQRDTTVVLGAVDRDLTGDGKLETLRLIGAGRSVDAMQFTLTIDGSGRTLYRASIHFSSRAEYERDRGNGRVAYRAWLNDIGKAFFDERKFQSPADFVASLRREADAHVHLIASVIASERGSPPNSVSADSLWAEIQRSAVTTFAFSSGGDATTAIAWSARDQRFYRLLQCC